MVLLSQECAQFLHVVTFCSAISGQPWKVRKVSLILGHSLSYSAGARNVEVERKSEAQSQVMNRVLFIVNRRFSSTRKDDQLLWGLCTSKRLGSLCSLRALRSIKARCNGLRYGIRFEKSLAYGGRNERRNISCSSSKERRTESRWNQWALCRFLFAICLASQRCWLLLNVAIHPVTQLTEKKNGHFSFSAVDPTLFQPWAS